MKLLVVILLTFSLFASGENIKKDAYIEKPPKAKKTVSLVLGSGGARGYAHIGVIEILEDQGYEIKSISGSSMGALIGGLYAAGKLEAYKKWILNLDTFEVLKLIEFSFDSGGMIDAEKVYESIREIIGDVKIEDLPIPYTAVSSDINNRKKVWFQKGKLIDAIRASIAIPTIFTPVVKDEMLLVDGGVLSPLPLDPVAQDPTDITIAVNLNAKTSHRYDINISQEQKEQENKLYKEVLRLYNEVSKVIDDDSPKKKNVDIFYVLGQTLDATQDIISEHDIEKYKPDIIIDIPRDSCESYEFDKGYMMIEIGKMAAKESLKKKE